MILFGSYAGRTRYPFAMPFKASVVVAVLLAGGCSADVARFDSPSFNLNGATGSVPSQTVRPSGGFAGPDSGGAYVPPRPSRGTGVEVAALPEVQQPTTPPASTPPPPATPAAAPARRPLSAPAASAAVVPSSSAPGEQIEVQHGDTLYGISKRYHVSVAELMQINGLQNPNLKPGQKLTLPGSKSARKPLIRQPVETAATPAPLPSGWDGAYTVKQGDSLYAIARQHNVKLSDLQRVNGISDARKVKPGTTLKVPSTGGAIATAPAAPKATPAPAPVAPIAAAEMPETSSPRPGARPTIINGEKKVAALGPPTDSPTAEAPAATTPAGERTASAAGAAAAGSTKLRWPARGKIIAGFGPRSDGTHNDGINLAVPMGTEVHAADAGVVAYAGSELKGYGNLVLIRHDNGWVTAYAHNDEIVVKRGDKVKRGQLLAKAGKTGQVDQPQVHFELRQGSKPVDPTPFMERI